MNILKKKCKHCSGNGIFISNVSRTYIKCRVCRGTGFDFSDKVKECKKK